MKEDVGSTSVLESTNGVQFSLKGTVWHQFAGSSSDQIGLNQLRSGLWGTGCGPTPVWTGQKPACSSLFLLLLPEALQQDLLVCGIQHSSLFQVFLCDVTEELQVVPAVV